jgi:hypothetical protein
MVQEHRCTDKPVERARPRHRPEKTGMMRAENTAQSAALIPPKADGGVLLALGPVSTVSLLCPQIHKTSAVITNFAH